MPEQIFTHTLTTKDRVKLRMSIDTAVTGTNFDTLIVRLINAATEYIEGYTNRRFKETTYTNEIYSIYGVDQKFLLLKQSPVSTLTSFQWRAGTPSTPSWTDFIADNYELLEDGASGIIRVYQHVPKGSNVVRATYKAGYLIDFTNYGDLTKHTLPADLTDACERIVVKLFKRREADGKVSESFDGGSVNWKDGLEADLIDILNGYRRLPVFV